MSYKFSVLFVDDENGILKALKRSLKNETYTKYFVDSADEALEVLRREEIAVIVSDIGLPKMNGVELLRLVEKEFPKVVKLALTGIHEMQEVVTIFDQVNLYKYITKPWNVEDMKTYINEALVLYMKAVVSEE